MIKVNSIIKLIRLKSLFWFSITTCFGFSAVILNKMPPLNFVYLVLSIVFANIGAIIINDLGDIDVDSKSPEINKRLRPLVTGQISKKEAILFSIIAFLLSLLFSFFYNYSATVFSIVIIIFSLSYSLPPTKFCARPYGSILYWIVLCISCYFLMLNTLANSNEELVFYLKYVQGWLFIFGIILFMGIAEIISKDLRDFENDYAGGRNTFVYFAGTEISSRIMMVFSWLGFIFWMQAFYMSNKFSTSIFGTLCFIIGLVLCTKITSSALKFTKSFDQAKAAKLHQNWINSYALMQILTFMSFTKI